MHVYVIGGGPSLKHFDWSRLRGQHVIAVNAAFKFVPWAEILFFSDWKFFQWHCESDDWRNFRGAKVTTCSAGPTPGCARWTVTYRAPLSDVDGQLAGECSGARALNLAYLLGYTDIRLLGYDMRPTGNFHDLHRRDGCAQNHYESHFIPSITKMGEELTRRGIKVTNYCPNSALTVFPRVDIT